VVLGRCSFHVSLLQKNSFHVSILLAQYQSLVLEEAICGFNFWWVSLEFNSLLIVNEHGRSLFQFILEYNSTDILLW
jgi:hypothetical protein